MSLTASILKSYYPVVCALREYLASILELVDDGHEFLVNEDDPAAYRVLLNQSYVALNDAERRIKRVRARPPMVNVREIIEIAQERLLARGKDKTSNIITSGYRAAKRDDELRRTANGRVAPTNFFVNTMVTALQAPEWQLLSQRIGEDAMFHLLTETSIFVSLPNECLCQMTGEPIIHLKTPQVIENMHARSSEQIACEMKRKIMTAHEDEKSTKRANVDKNQTISRTSSWASTKAATSKTVVEKCSVADISFARSRMFYAWPYLIPPVGNIAVGLPPKHILNRIAPSYKNKPEAQPAQWVDPDPRTQAEHARHLSKYVFPRQYGLESPFVVSAQLPFQTYKVPDFSNKEDEIKKMGPCKTPKRLKPILVFLDQLIWRHSKCRYKALLDLVCSSKVKANNEPLETSIILEMMSEYTSQLRTQASVSGLNASTDTIGNPIIPQGLTQARRHAQHKPRFAEFACSFAEVSRYAILATDAVIPRAFWGYDANRRAVYKHIQGFVASRRYEKTTLHNVLQGFSVTECDWLAPDSAAARAQSRVSVIDALKRRELLEEFLFWYYDSFLMPLLKTTFYITESSAFRRRVLYFRQDDWSTLCAPLIDKLSHDTFQKIEQPEAEEILRQRKLGFSFVRLLPKETGVRPIVNLRRKGGEKKEQNRYQPSINQILQTAFHILTYEKEHQPQLLGASVFGSNEIYTKLKAYKSRLLEFSPNKKTLPELYFVKLDVQACFDSIEQTKLLEILRDAISEDAYMLQRYGQVNTVGSKIRRKYAKRAQPEDDHPHFLDTATQLAAALRHTIFVDQVVYPFANREELIELLEEHIAENIVKIGNDYYRQVVGIPQGSVLSALLCSFFYGDLERQHFKFTEDPQSLLLRLIDDYLFITTDLARAKRFLAMMMKGHPEYGCFISVDKTLTNFDFDPTMNVTDPHQKNFPWCGHMINMGNLSVSTDYTRYHETYLQDSLTVERGRHPGVTFVHKMMQSTKAKSHILYSDPELNSTRTVFLNVYQNFLLSAMKMHHYLRQWGINVKKHNKFIQNTVQRMLKYTYTTMRNKATNRVAKASGGRCEVSEVQVIWLGTHAFFTVFSRKPHAYPQLVAWLQFQLSLPRNRRLKKQFNGTVKEGLQTLTLLSF